MFVVVGGLKVDGRLQKRKQWLLFVVVLEFVDFVARRGIRDLFIRGVFAKLAWFVAIVIPAIAFEVNISRSSRRLI